MKRAFVVLTLAALVAQFSFAQSVSYGGGSFEPAEGNWVVLGNELAQVDANAPRAKINLRLPQSGQVEYQFDVRYISGGEDGYAAFGAHIFVDQPHGGVSWGNGSSYLLWMTYDPTAYGGSGVWAQVYKSSSDGSMKLHEYARIPYHFGIPAQYIQSITMAQVQQLPLLVRIRVDANTGIVSVKDPTQFDLWWSFTLGERLTQGRYITLRTSSLAASFSNLRMVQLN